LIDYKNNLIGVIKNLIIKDVLVAINKNKYERSSKSYHHGRSRTGFSQLQCLFPG
jgi:hypothetical protein